MYDKDYNYLFAAGPAAPYQSSLVLGRKIVYKTTDLTNVDSGGFASVSWRGAGLFLKIDFLNEFTNNRKSLFS